MTQQRLITFTTDFGSTDHFVGTMRGVILSINPQAQMFDICNAVQAFDVLDGALTIAHSYRYFPPNTIHMVIVDPGVGTSRRPILVTTEKHMFLAPDNGVLSLVYEQEERISVRHITSEHYFLQPTSMTFHGRDIFAAVAGWLSKGVEASKFGEEVTDYVRFGSPKVKRIDEKTLKGVVLKVDRFGNLVTNIREEHVPNLLMEVPPDFRIVVGKGEVKRMRRTFGEGAAGEVFGIIGSMGYLEIVANRSNASSLLQATKGSDVHVVFEQAQWAANGPNGGARAE